MAAWEILGRELANCNCAFGCPCQFNALPTHGNCEAAGIFVIDRGHYGDVSLDGLAAAGVYKWPGAVHEGNGEMQLIIDERASDEQRQALETIMTGGDTAEMATMWWIFHAMCSTRHETLYRRFDVALDVAARSGKATVEGLLEVVGNPILNPVTGAEHRARIELPNGFEFRVAEAARGTTKTADASAIALRNNHDSHAHFAELHLCQDGFVQEAA